MTTRNPLLNKIAGLEGLHWGILGEYVYSTVIVVHVACFLPQKKTRNTSHTAHWAQSRRRLAATWRNSGSAGY